MVRASRSIHPVSLIALDLDSFKGHHDKWGPPAGDARIREIADPEDATSIEELAAKRLEKNRVYTANVADKSQNW